MRIVEVVMGRDIALQVRVLLADRDLGVLLGREFGSARLILGVLPWPERNEDWEALHGLAHGPVGAVGREFDSKVLDRLLPGDILLRASPDIEPGEWKAEVLDWTGPADETVRRQVPLSVG